jgi:hypothetical protein
LVFLFKPYKMDFDEDEAPPLLVDTEAKENDVLEEPKQVKVPITIVTGKSLLAPLVAWY